MFTVPSHFIWSFKTGDNINFNLRLLALLYTYHAAASDEERILLRKPMVITLVSIIEALLADFHSRTRGATFEGVDGLTREIVDYIRGRKLDEFEKHIVSARKHNLLRMKDKFYDVLDELRRLRNRIHIQNKKGDFEADEGRVFDTARLERAEKALERTVKRLAELYPRPIHARGVEDFAFPWEEHFPDEVELG